MTLWRIASAAHAACDGEGARRYGSRWTARGVAVVYASATLSLAALERFVHTDPDLEAAALVAIALEVPGDLPIDTLDAADLPANWRRYPAPEALTRFGARWLKSARSAVLAVPSVVIPHERNYVINPAHDGFARITIARPEPFSFDPRMWGRRTRR